MDRNLYKTARWQRVRRKQLTEHPFCRMCLETGRPTKATVCDHVHRHGGDTQKFWAGPFQSLCAAHHDKYKQQQENRGYSTEIGADGLPLDPAHPFHEGRASPSHRPDLKRRTR